MGEAAGGDAHVPKEFDLEGHVDARGIRYFGKATRGANGKWKCLADVGGSLCVVECAITFDATSASSR